MSKLKQVRETVGPERARTSLFGFSSTVAALLVGGVAGALLSSQSPRSSDVVNHVTVSPAQREEPAAISAVPKAPAMRSVAPVSNLAKCLDDEDSEEKQARLRDHQSKEVVSLLMARLNIVDGAFRGAPAEMVLNHLRPYQVGLMEGIIRAVPELTDDIARHVEDELCKPGARDTQLMVLARLAGDVPGLATAAGFDCIFEKRTKEDPVLLTALEAWRQSGLDPTPGIATVERMATEPRTKELLRPRAVAGELAADVLALQSAASSQPGAGR